MKDLRPDELRNLQVVAAGLVAGPVVFFGIGLLLRLTAGRPLGDVPALTHAAVLFAVASPMIAGLVRSRLTAAESPVTPPSREGARAALITYLGVLEAAAFLCGVALLSTPTWWPLMAAAVPLGAMLAAFPRRE